MTTGNSEDNPLVKNKALIKMAVMVLPVLAMVLLIGVNVYNQSTGTYWRVPVTGYDPRDLLRGHYITFRYDWDIDNSHKVRGESALCLSAASEGETFNPKAVLHSRPKAMESCSSYIIGEVTGSRFRIGAGAKRNGDLTRFYIPEQHARMLDRMIRGWGADADKYDFSIALRVNGMGNAFIDDMFIDDVPIKDWLMEYEQKQKQENEQKN
jgi:uncharacterized membrane-anchored protein